MSTLTRCRRFRIGDSITRAFSRLRVADFAQVGSSPILSLFSTDDLGVGNIEPSPELVIPLR